MPARTLSQESYDWMHGYNARSSISNAPLKFWYAHREDSTPPCVNLDCRDSCVACQAEKTRRNRLLLSFNHTSTMADTTPPKLPPDFKEAILISPHNQACFHYSLHKARQFAARHNRQLMWCPPRDIAPAFFVAGYTAEEEAKATKPAFLQCAQHRGRPQSLPHLL